MPKYRFASQNDQNLPGSMSIGEFTIEGTSFEDAVDGLAFELQCHDEWTVRPQAGGVQEVDLYLKGHFIDTLLASELPS